MHVTTMSAGVLQCASALTGQGADIYGMMAQLAARTGTGQHRNGNPLYITMCKCVSRTK